MPARYLLSLRTFCLAAVFGASALVPAHAQDTTVDTRAPVIEIEVVEDARADTTQRFTAQVADNRELAGVTLHHRRAGEQPFARTPMRRVGTSDYYGVSLPTDPEDGRAIEYYVQAIDETGNRTVNGFAFDPRIRTLTPLAMPDVTPPVVAAVPPPAPPPESTSSGGPRWWAIALGVIAIGAVASLAGSEGDDGGGSSGSGNTVPLVIDLPEPQ